MRYLSVCSGIEAASVAWAPLGWTLALFSEIEDFPRAVLYHRHQARDVRASLDAREGQSPRNQSAFRIWAKRGGASFAQLGTRDGVPLWGDFTTIRRKHLERLGIDPKIDLLVGGTPCQSFSVAGLRGGMGDSRGALALHFLVLARRLRPRWVVWENVPGVLSADEGRAFGSFLGGLEELGYGWAYRILDAQYVRALGFSRGVPQRRRRVFVIGYLGDWRSAAAVLFEPSCLRGYSKTRASSGKASSSQTSKDSGGAGVWNSSGYANWRDGVGTLIANPQGHGTSECAPTLSTTRVPGVYQGDRVIDLQDSWPAIPAGGGNQGGGGGAVLGSPVPRRITPREAERLQGFPDDFTLVPWRVRTEIDAEWAEYIRHSYPELSDEQLSCLASDGLRYRAIGNSMAVNVMRRLGERIMFVERVLSETKEVAISVETLFREVTPPLLGETPLASAVIVPLAEDSLFDSVK